MPSSRRVMLAPDLNKRLVSMCSNTGKVRIDMGIHSAAHRTSLRAWRGILGVAHCKRDSAFCNLKPLRLEVKVDLQVSLGSYGQRQLVQGLLRCTQEQLAG